MNEGIPTPEASMEAMLAKLKAKLEQIGSLEKQLSEALRIEVTANSVDLFEELAHERSFFEGINFEGGRPVYDASFATSKELDDEQVIEFIERLEKTRGISFESGPPVELTQAALKRILDAVENL